MRHCGVALGFAHGAIEAVERDEGQAVCADEFAHFFDGVFVCEELFTLWRVDAIEAAMRGRRAGNPHVDFLCACAAEHIDDFDRGRASHDGVIDQNHALAFDETAVGVVFQLNAQMPDMVGRLDECTSDIVVADDSKIEGDFAFLGIADGGRHA